MPRTALCTKGCSLTCKHAVFCLKASRTAFPVDGRAHKDHPPLAMTYESHLSLSVPLSLLTVQFLKPVCIVLSANVVNLETQFDGTHE